MNFFLKPSGKDSEKMNILLFYTRLIFILIFILGYIYLAMDLYDHPKVYYDGIINITTLARWIILIYATVIILFWSWIFINRKNLKKKNDL